MKLVTSAAELAPVHGGVFVPTMGALHEGHEALIRHAVTLRGAAVEPRPVVVSIFVNPTQFNDPADLARYPRTLDDDLVICRRAGADAVFAPAPNTIYPPGITIPTPPLPEVATLPGLEDARRPGHFAGVCQVVARLFDLVRPSAAVFGEKDWQQLQVITAMTEHLGLPIRIIPSPTIREPDGLAMSSRNVFLSPEDRLRAVALSRALCEACSAPSPAAAESVMTRILADGGIQPEYVVVREAASLMPDSQNRAATGYRSLIAARVGAVRLIDNAPWTFGRAV